MNEREIAEMLRDGAQEAIVEYDPEKPLVEQIWAVGDVIRKGLLAAGELSRINDAPIAMDIYHKFHLAFAKIIVLLARQYGDELSDEFKTQFVYKLEDLAGLSLEEPFVEDLNVVQFPRR